VQQFIFKGMIWRTAVYCFGWCPGLSIRL